MNTIAFRLKPGQDIKEELVKFSQTQKISGTLLTCVGSLSLIEVRFAGATKDKQYVRKYEGDYEITSLIGTLSPDGVHLHICFSDKDGSVIGGHLKGRAIVKTTAEIVIAVETNKVFKRKLDKTTGFDELEIENKV